MQRGFSIIWTIVVLAIIIVAVAVLINWLAAEDNVQEEVDKITITSNRKETVNNDALIGFAVGR